MTSVLFKALELMGIRYFIPWGYENLPKPSGGDIDVCVHPTDFTYVEDALKTRGYTMSECPRYGKNHKHARFTCPNETTIDLFTTFCFGYKGKTTVLSIDPFCLLPTKIGDYWIAHPIIESLFTSLRVIGGRIDCVKRLEKFFS